jgi:hypothetical protein
LSCLSRSSRASTRGDTWRAKEVTRHDARRLGTQERRPRVRVPARRRINIRVLQDCPNRRCRDGDPESGEFTVDTAVAPRRVLPSEADDDPPSLDCDGSPAGPVRLGPVVCDDTSMPAQDGVRFDQEGRPAVAAAQHEQLDHEANTTSRSSRRADLRRAPIASIIRARNPRLTCLDGFPAPTGRRSPAVERVRCWRARAASLRCSLTYASSVGLLRQRRAALLRRLGPCRAGPGDVVRVHSDRSGEFAERVRDVPIGARINAEYLSVDDLLQPPSDLVRRWLNASATGCGSPSPAAARSSARAGAMASARAQGSETTSGSTVMPKSMRSS